MIATIGHSSHLPKEFVARCRSAGVKTIVDIRSHPRSRWNWFNRDQLEPNVDRDSWLERAGIRYLWVPALGGWNDNQAQDELIVTPATDMPRPNRAPDDAHTATRVKLSEWADRRSIDLTVYNRPKIGEAGLRDFTWFTALPSFRSAAEWLVRESQPGYSLKSPALMCAEFMWTTCHRRIVADYLRWCHNTEVMHLQPRAVPHSQSIDPDRWNSYPAEVLRVWGPNQDRRG